MPRTARSRPRVEPTDTGPVTVIHAGGADASDQLEAMIRSESVREMEIVLQARSQALSRRRIGRYAGFGALVIGYGLTASLALSNFAAAVDHTDQIISLTGFIASLVAAVGFVVGMAVMLAARRRRRREMERILAAYLNAHRAMLAAEGRTSEDPLPDGMFTRPRVA